ncbi:MAG: serine/threonine protein kinase, partial [Planctomycetales bacterium 12-60-4]
ENVHWSATVGDGIGCPIVADGRVFVSGMTGDETVTLFAYDAATGKKLWQRDWATGPLPDIHKTNSQASATPAADGERVYFYFWTLGLLTVDAKTGADVWEQTLPIPFFVFKWGPGMSPVLYKDLVLFCQDDDLAPALYAFDKRSGELRWKDDRVDMAVNYSHPVVCTVDGRDEIVVGGTGMLIGYDPATGHRNWFAKVLLRNIKTTPVVQDGKLDKDEIRAFVGKQPIPEAFFAKTFGRGDLNKDGFLEGRELDVAFLHPDNFAGASFESLGPKAAEERILAVRGGGHGDVTKTHVMWMHPTKYTDHIVSPFVSEGRMFLIKCGGLTTVFDTKTGEPTRSVQRLGGGGDYFASPVAGDGKIYLASENGTVLVLKNTEDFEELADNDLGESIVATPAISDGRLYIRTRTKLLTIGTN